eukprot:880299-Pyramimonas_sp.AAC.1
MSSRTTGTALSTSPSLVARTASAVAAAMHLHRPVGYVFFLAVRHSLLSLSHPRHVSCPPLPCEQLPFPGVTSRAACSPGSLSAAILVGALDV